jgi:hypothetical protein
MALGFVLPAISQPAVSRISGTHHCGKPLWIPLQLARSLIHLRQINTASSN